MRKKVLVLLAIIIVATAAATAFVYPDLPPEIATHWNAAGEADGYSRRLFGAALMPLVMLGLALLFLIVPKIDPLKKNYAEFRGVYELFVVVLLLFMALVHGITLASGLGYAVSVSGIIFAGIGGLFVIIGRLMPRMKRNWFMGIRTPWTLSSDTVWESTHQLGGRVFTGLGVLMFGAAFLPGGAPVIAIVVLALTGSLGLFVYSYLQFRQEQREIE